MDGHGNAIQIRDLKKTLDGKPVLKGISLDIEHGRTTCIIGPSGCGKSVLLKNLVGLMCPDEGEITIGGQDVTRFTETQWNGIRKKCGMVFQNAALFDYLTVRDNVAFPLEEFTDMPLDEINERVSKTLSMVGLRKVEGIMPSALSGGMRKRVGIARAIINRPDIMFYDEPTTGLDPITSDVINDLIRGLNSSLGVTAVVVTHDMKSAYKVGDWIAMMYSGRIRVKAAPDSIRNSTDPFVQQFIEGRGQGPISIVRQDTRIVMDERKKISEEENEGETRVTHL